MGLPSILFPFTYLVELAMRAGSSAAPTVSSFTLRTQADASFILSRFAAIAPAVALRPDPVILQITEQATGRDLYANVKAVGGVFPVGNLTMFMGLTDGNISAPTPPSDVQGQDEKRCIQFAPASHLIFTAANLINQTFTLTIAMRGYHSYPQAIVAPVNKWGQMVSLT